MSLDDFQTPISTVEAILDRGVLDQATSVLEPCAGRGNVIRAIRETGYDHHITAIEINDRYQPNADRIIMEDFLHEDINSEFIGKFDLIITNPPFSKVEEFISKSHSLLNNQGKLVMLLRMSILGGIKRARFFDRYHPSKVYILGQRPKFPMIPLDHVPYCWMIWNNPISREPTILEWIHKYDFDDQRVHNGRKV